MDLPAARSPDSYRIAVVCLGNICRSPMAAAVLGSKLARVGLEDTVLVDSSGTGGWHVGGRMDDRAAAVLSAAGYDAAAHRAAQFTAQRAAEHDLVLAMDASNAEDLRRLGVGPSLRRFRDFDPQGPGDVPDPYYGGEAGFDDVLAIVERTADAIVAALKGRE
jgi:protein-tyrosine phosphatase